MHRLTRAGVTIAVGGMNSRDDLRSGLGVFVTASLLDPEAVRLALPAYPTAGRYRPIEEQVYQRAHDAAARNGEVDLLGYSHGATLILRVAHWLAERGLAGRVRVATIDRVTFGYPVTLSPHYASVPDGIISGFNIYQTADNRLHGGKVAGAEEVLATDRILTEKTGLPMSRKERRYHGQFEYHYFMQESAYVRGEILKRFG
jgi:hypothetical protein